MYNMAFAGFRHSHINSLYAQVKNCAEINIAGAFEENGEAREAAKKNPGADFIYKTYEDLLSDGSVDIVAIGDYFGIRGERAIKALKAGKNVFIDKPVCTSLRELDEIKELSASSELKVGCMLDMRFSGFVPTVREIISGGGIGKIQTICFGGQHPLNYGSRPAWYYEDGKHGGVINDIAIHGIDLIYHIAGLEVKNVVGAREWNGFALNEPQFNDCAQFIAELSNGAGLIGDVSYSTPNSLGYNSPYYWRFLIYGTGGLIEFGTNLKDVRVCSGGSGTIEKIITPEKIGGDSLSEFIKELKGEDCALNTEGVIRSTGNTLKIQDRVNK